MIKYISIIIIVAFAMGLMVGIKIRPDNNDFDFKKIVISEFAKNEAEVDIINNEINLYTIGEMKSNEVEYSNKLKSEFNITLKHYDSDPKHYLYRETFAQSYNSIVKNHIIVKYGANKWDSVQKYALPNK